MNPLEKMRLVVETQQHLQKIFWAAGHRRLTDNEIRTCYKLTYSLHRLMNKLGENPETAHLKPDFTLEEMAKAQELIEH